MRSDTEERRSSGRGGELRTGIACAITSYAAAMARGCSDVIGIVSAKDGV